MMDVAECGRGLSWPNLSYYSGIFLGRIKKVMKIPSKRIGFSNLIPANNIQNPVRKRCCLKKLPYSEQLKNWRSTTGNLQPN
jgi:hypothetical protein